MVVEVGRLKPYTRMKDSGVPWLGEVPAHWLVVPNRAIFTEAEERDRPDEQLLSVTITRGVVPQRLILAEGSKKDGSKQDKSAYKVVRPGDIAYNKMRAWQGAIGVSDDFGIVSPAYVVERPGANANPHYLHHLLRTPAFAKEAERWSYGIASDMWSLRPHHFKMIYACLPPKAEQEAIVRFVAHVDRCTRHYIHAKQKLIKLLEEQRQAIIRRAVCRGLDPNPPLRPSGVGWLGDVPEHWDISALRRRWEVVDCKHLTVPFTDEGLPLASVREAQQFDLSLDGANRTPRAWLEVLVEGGRQPKRGDLVYCRNVSVGAAAIVVSDDEFAMGQDVCLIRSRTENQRWLNYYLHSRPMAEQLAEILVGSTFKRINVADVKALLVPVPPRGEQDRIAHYLDVRMAPIEFAIRRARDGQRLLREYRTRLVADVVTGKVDVREAAARLPEELEDTGDVDEVDAVDDADAEIDEDAEAEEPGA